MVEYTDMPWKLISLDFIADSRKLFAGALSEDGYKSYHKMADFKYHDESGWIQIC